MTSKWWLWCHTFELEMTSSIFFNFTRYLHIVYSYQILASSDLNQKKILRNLSLWSCFQPSTPPLAGCDGNNEWAVLKFLISKDDLYNCLQIHKVWWRSIKPFLRYLAKPSGGHFAPSPNRVNNMRPNHKKSIVYCCFIFAFYKQ